MPTFSQGQPRVEIKGTAHFLFPSVLFVRLYLTLHYLMFNTLSIPIAPRLQELESSRHLWSQKCLEGEEARCPVLATVLAPGTNLRHRSGVLGRNTADAHPPIMDKWPESMFGTFSITGNESCPTS